MANDRMWLINRKTGQRVLLAKHNGVGWWNYHEDLGVKLAEAFDDQEALHYDIPGSKWELEYET